MTPNEPNPDEVDPHRTRNQFITESDEARPAPGAGADEAATLAKPRRLAPDPHHDLPPTTPQTTEGTRYQGDRTFPGGSTVEVGRTLYGKYRVIRQLGGGAMGDVWLVRHLSLNRDHALKMIVPHLASHQGALVRFQREFQVMASFHHEHAVEIYDAKLDEEGGYIDMQYVEGPTITQILAGAKAREGRDPSAPLMPFPWLLRVLGQLCEVLDVAHEAGIVHRDLKPSNLMLLGKRPPGREFLKVLDFGIAKIRHDPENNLNDATLTGGFIGTPSYSSPEQVYSKPIDGRSDLYSVGVILYEILCGRLPFVGQQVQVMMQHAQQPPPPFARANPGLRVAPEVEHAVFRVLAKDPDERPATGRALYEEFAEAASSHTSHAVGVVIPGSSSDPTPPTWDASPYHSPPIEPTEPDGPESPAGPPAPAVIARPAPRESATGGSSHEVVVDPGPGAGPRPPLGRKPAFLAAVALALIGLVAVPIVAMRRDTRTDPGKTGQGPAKSSDKAPDRDASLPDGYLAVKGVPRIDGWPEQVRRDEDQGLYRLFAPGVYLPDGFEVEDAGGGSPDLVQGWPRVIRRKDDPTHALYIRIPGGREFVMGAWDAPDDLGRKDAPAHPVILFGFYLQQHEVSNGQIEDFYATNSARSSPVQWLDTYDALKRRIKDTARDHPAVNLSRKEANAYARSFGGKLPTEAQWEYAARSLGQRRPYVWGSKPPTRKLANIESELADVTTAPSGEYKEDVTEQHIYDMAGNVQEWCRDAWAPYRKTAGPARDPFVPEGGPGGVEKYAVRGASWNSIVAEAFVTWRDESYPEATQKEFLGLRVVLECPDIALKP